MIKQILFIVFISCSITLTGQIYEIGATIGGTNYVGDIGETNYIKPNKLAGNIFFKYNYNPRIAIRAMYSYLPIKDNDLNADTDFRVNRGLRFSNTINEISAGIDFNFYEYDMAYKDNSWTPYIIAELALFNYAYVSGTNATGDNILDRKTRFAVPFGVGFKSRLIGNLAFAIETKFRYTFDDDLDYLDNTNTQFNVEGNSSDWYMFTGISIIYTFGRRPCYTKGL